MNNHIKIITTEDGSQSLYNQELNETYHSTHGALTESRHVFIKHGLEFLVSRGKTKLRILEVGFGTGLNVLLTWEYSKDVDQVHIDYVTLEPFPLSSEVTSDLKYHDLLGDRISKLDFEKLHSCAWETGHELSPNFSFLKHRCPLQHFTPQVQSDLVFYDAFAPGKQAEMWDVKVLEYTMNLMSDQGVLVTYCAKGQFKRDLQALGFKLETLPGPPGKHEMVRAIKP